MDFKDLFSGHSQDYSKFRPTYPDSLFQYLASVSPSRDCVWDCGTGNGQAAVALASYFSKVRATDPSAKQLSQAVANPRVTYEVGSAESSPLSSQSVDLITVAQAFHWFKHEAFFKEARRVLKPHGVVAVWCYKLANISPEVDAVVRTFYEDVIGSYWEPERRYVDEGYRNISMPLKEFSSPAFEMKARWNLSQWTGYLGTWSAVHSATKALGTNPLQEFFPKLSEAWGEAERAYEIRWPLSLRAGNLTER